MATDLRAVWDEDTVPRQQRVGPNVVRIKPAGVAHQWLEVPDVSTVSAQDHQAKSSHTHTTHKMPVPVPVPVPVVVVVQCAV